MTDSSQANEPPRCDECGAGPPLVGVGGNPPPPDHDWLCLACFDLAMRRLCERLRQFRQARLN